MTDPSFPAPLGQAAWLAEFARLNKIIQSLMNRAERCARAQSSDLGVFQRTILLEEQVSVRTDELQAALRENEIANRALRESEAKFRSVADQSLVGIVVIDDGKFSYTNAKFNEIFGYDAVEIRHLGPVEVTVESDRALVASQVLARMSGAGDRLAYTFHGLRKDGEVLDIECHSSVIDVGRSRLLVSLMMDVTARTRARSACESPGTRTSVGTPSSRKTSDLTTSAVDTPSSCAARTAVLARPGNCSTSCAMSASRRKL